MIFCPELTWQFWQSKLQYLSRQQFCCEHEGQLMVWQISQILIRSFRYLYSCWKSLRKTQLLRLAADRNNETVLIFSNGTGNLAMISILDSLDNLSKDSLVMNRLVMCTFFPLPSSASITLLAAQSTLTEAITIPCAPRDCALMARFVNEQKLLKSVLMARQVGRVRCGSSLTSPHRLWLSMTRSKLLVFPYGTSPQLAQKQGSSLLGNSVTSGLVMMRVAVTARQKEAQSAILIIDYQSSSQQTYVRMELLIASLLRPYRSTYSHLDLGRRKTNHYERQDETLTNDRDQTIHYSYYANNHPADVCVIYCHCNSGSRMEGLQYLEKLAERGWNVCLFDFSGSGMSQGTHISLGYNEARDLECILRKMRSKGNRKFLLWGRSMGAATIIFHLREAKSREDIVACVLDSPYASLWSLMKQIGAERSVLPGFIVEHLMDYLRERIKQEYCFDIKQLQPLKSVGHLDMPLLFITSLMDDFVKSEDVVQLYRAASSRNKQLEYIDKAHNANRDPQTIAMAAAFMQKSLVERAKRRKQLKIFVKNNKDLTGGNMADLIIKAEREKDHMRRMKSEVHLDKSCKENRSKLNNIQPHHLKTELSHTPTPKTNDYERDQTRCRGKTIERKRAIKYSLAHLEHQKKELTIRLFPNNSQNI